MRGKKTVRRVAFTAVFTALSAAFLYIASVIPTGQLGFLGIASLCGIAAVVEYGLAGGLFVYIGTGLLGLFLVPSKTLVGLYAVFFGVYPIVKALSERFGRIAEWCVKLAFFNATLSAALFALKMTLFDLTEVRYGIYLLYALGNIVFAIFDIAVSRAISAYMAKIHPRIK